jgi:hypothetical protein
MYALFVQLCENTLCFLVLKTLCLLGTLKFGVFFNTKDHKGCTKG